MNPSSRTHTSPTEAFYLQRYHALMEPNSVLPPDFITSDLRRIPILAQTKLDGKIDTSCKRHNIIFPNTYQLTGYDVLVGRHKLAFNHVGNRRFRVVVSMFLPRYIQNPSRQERSLLILEIVETISRAGGHFLKQNKYQQLVEISEKEKRNKVGHALRDAAAAESAGQLPKTRVKLVMEQEKLPELLQRFIRPSEKDIDFDLIFSHYVLQGTNLFTASAR
jgi:hypothetical protein